jgi:hypothetical protein
MQQALTGADIVVIPAGIPRKSAARPLWCYKLIPTRQAWHDPR